MEIRNLNFAYGENKILSDFSFNIHKGKITTIIGGNGCGKSTLFNLMTKNLKASSGEIFLDGENIRDIKLKDFAKKVAIVHQHNTAPEDITVKQLVAYGRTPYVHYRRRDHQEDERLINWAMEVTEVTAYQDRCLSELSGGQRQRVWIAMALAQNTKILFLDEPTTYLDVRYQIQLLHLIKRLNKEHGITIVMVLHDINQAIHYSDEIIGLGKGKLIAGGKPDEVITVANIEAIYGLALEISYIQGKKYVLMA